MHVKASYKNRIKLCILYSSLVEAIKELPAFYKGFFYFYFIAEGDWKWAIRRERKLVVTKERECRERWEGEKKGLAPCTRLSHSLPTPARALSLTPMPVFQSLYALR